MASVNLHIDSTTLNKTVLVNSTDNYNVKEKIEISAPQGTDTVLISTVEFSKASNYENIINLTLTRQEFTQLIQFAQTLI